MRGFNWNIVGIVAAAVFAIAVAVCFVAPLFVSMFRDMWEYALS